MMQESVDLPNIEPLVQLLTENRWVAATVVAINLIVGILKRYQSHPWVAWIPSKARPLVALVLGVVSATLDMVARGTRWQTALLHGVLSAAVAVFLHQFVVEGARGGKELVPPK